MPALEPNGLRGAVGGGPVQAGALGAQPFAEDIPYAPELDHAVNSLRRARPDMSAAELVTDAQRFAFAALLAGTIVLAALAPYAGYQFALAAFAVPFAFVALIRLVALLRLLVARRTAPGASGVAADLEDGRTLPSYSLLVPLYKEDNVVPALVAALAAIDYPRDLTEVLFITEANDAATRAALARAGLPAFMRVLTVPEGAPRTKPRALNFALTFAKGDMIAVYDAEDAPEPSQLRAAVAAFRAAGPDLACVQARLNIYNPGSNFFTRQFTLEYSALFDAILPALEWLRLPLPLGGTSNHFPRAVLEAAGAWDLYNVTEDADLGLRLARLGLRTEMLPSITWEEAPASARAWFGQRTRWIKGWMQTYLVHMRLPLRLLGELGGWRFFGFQVVFGGLILSALVHPLIFITAARQYANGSLFGAPSSPFEAGLWTLSACNLAVAYLSAMALAAVAVAHRGGMRLVRSALGLPLYWFAISLAAYAALFELVRRPHYWAKTAHTGEGRDGLAEEGALSRNLDAHSPNVSIP